MTESEFNELANGVLERIERSIDASGPEIECCLNGPVLELEFADRSKIVVNSHGPTREIWLAAKAGGFHYAYRDGRWISGRDGSELFDKLSELVSMATGETVEF